MFGMLKGLVGSKSLTREDMDPVLEKMKDHLIGTCAAGTTVSFCGDPDITDFPFSTSKRKTWRPRSRCSSASRWRRNWKGK